MLRSLSKRRGLRRFMSRSNVICVILASLSPQCKAAGDWGAPAVRAKGCETDSSHQVGRWEGGRGGARRT